MIVPFAQFSPFCVNIKSVSHISPVVSYLSSVTIGNWDTLNCLITDFSLFSRTCRVGATHELPPHQPLALSARGVRKHWFFCYQSEKKPFSCWKLKLNYLFPYSIFIALSWWKNNASSIRRCLSPTILLSCLFLPWSHSPALLWVVKCGQSLSVGSHGVWQRATHGEEN